MFANMLVGIFLYLHLESNDHRNYAKFAISEYGLDRSVKL